ncbi:alpha-hydroxy-acid oxidizing protein [Oenococcus kitaharae]|uniref:Isopentenyl-diphosphate delta-isomerase n=1 Tax=Oenococcus kitaharae DSM 17330 TaxID=1045004 RepID=G9WFS3_9LACO|nr:alpha-hydroxy-acid oxidizing protein [Oenococcus kitaharae]EHN59446.1 Isopentenyl-diphosphate delta-isomerase, FMN-dependent [Oenococcus kitaharae DSM 17330]OEY83315.1 isopentenyl pyrophosphate isomerase [Oenococcus kitaharae]OEY85113.1 isopentenyl pyrophosphate isomerase [Oenococcus kitaharae]OEY85968.1 isopentenyl pyrophosphate isomerase [Oenococcus kitaharae]
MTDKTQKIESAHAHRKDEHLSLAIWQWRNNRPFNDLRYLQLDRPILPNVAVKDVDTSVTLFGHRFQWPFYIEAMTGGSLRTGAINQKLSQIAKKYDLAMAVGSESIAIKEKETRKSFSIVREENPEGFIFANIGAGHSAQDAKEAIKIVDADALEIHVNAVQELSMNDGDRDFTKWQSNITQIIDQVSVPVIIKEVGFGMSQTAIETLSALQPAAINVAGSGGTDFGRIEERRNRTPLWQLFADGLDSEDDDSENDSDDPEMADVLTSNDCLGISTSDSLRFARQADTQTPIIANGGITNTPELFNALALGAKMAGVAGYFLFQLSKHQLGETIESWQKQLPLLYAMYGVKKSSQIAALKELNR